MLRWALVNDEFRVQYTRARELQSDCFVDEIPDIADDGANDYMMDNNPDNPGYRENGESIRRSQLRIDARKWTAGKMRPKKYSDKFMQEISGPDGSPIEVVEISQGERAARIATALRIAAAKGTKGS